MEVLFMKMRPVLACLLVTSSMSYAYSDKKPLADWFIQTIVSERPPIGHGIVRRAILSWNETWPSLHIEVDDWSKGMGGQEVLLLERIQIEGDMKICPDPAEAWCGEMREIYWKDGRLHHSFNARGKTYVCASTILDNKSVHTTCKSTQK